MARQPRQEDGSNIAEVGVEAGIVFRRIVPGLRRVDFVSNCTFCRPSARLCAPRRGRVCCYPDAWFHIAHTFREAFFSRSLTLADPLFPLPALRPNPTSDPRSRQRAWKEIFAPASRTCEPSVKKIHGRTHARQIYAQPTREFISRARPFLYSFTAR